MAALAAIAVAADAGAQTHAAGLQGEWRVTQPNDPTFSGVVLLDRLGRVTWNATWSPEYRASHGITAPEVGKGAEDGRSVWRGYLRVSLPTVELILTNGTRVDRLLCALQSSDLLHCEGGKRAKALVVMARIGPGPESLAPQ